MIVSLTTFLTMSLPNMAWIESSWLNTRSWDSPSTNTYLSSRGGLDIQLTLRIASKTESWWKSAHSRDISLIYLSKWSVSDNHSALGLVFIGFNIVSATTDIVWRHISFFSLSTSFSFSDSFSFNIQFPHSLTPFMMLELIIMFVVFILFS